MPDYTYTFTLFYSFHPHTLQLGISKIRKEFVVSRYILINGCYKERGEGSKCVKFAVAYVETVQGGSNFFLFAKESASGRIGLRM